GVVVVPGQIVVAVVLILVARPAAHSRQPRLLGDFQAQFDCDLTTTPHVVTIQISSELSWLLRFCVSSQTALFCVPAEPRSSLSLSCVAAEFSYPTPSLVVILSDLLMTRIPSSLA